MAHWFNKIRSLRDVSVFVLRRYMGEILLIRRKTLSNQSIKYLYKVAILLAFEKRMAHYFNKMAFSKGYRVLEGKIYMRNINNDDASRTENGQIYT